MDHSLAGVMPNL